MGQPVLDHLEELVDLVHLDLGFLAVDLPLLPSLVVGLVVDHLLQLLELLGVVDDVCLVDFSWHGVRNVLH